MNDDHWMREAIRLSSVAMTSNLGSPFGAVVVRDGKLIGSGHNTVVSTNDPTAHGEVVAIRDACRRLGCFELPGAELYTSCEPCPMCLATIYWAKIDRVYYANSCADAAPFGFDDVVVYREIAKPMAERRVKMSQLLGDEALEVFKAWAQRTSPPG